MALITKQAGTRFAKCLISQKSGSDWLIFELLWLSEFSLGSFEQLIKAGSCIITKSFSDEAKGEERTSKNVDSTRRIRAHRLQHCHHHYYYHIKSDWINIPFTVASLPDKAGRYFRQASYATQDGHLCTGIILFNCTSFLSINRVIWRCCSLPQLILKMRPSRLLRQQQQWRRQQRRLQQR